MAAYVDVEDMLTGWLKTTLGFVNVTNELPANLVDLIRSNPVIVLERIGGNDTLITFDVARVDVDVFANSRDGAKLHAATIHGAALTRLRGYIHNGTAVAKVTTVSAPVHAPYDSRNVIRRVRMTLQIHLHQFSGVS